MNGKAVSPKCCLCSALLLIPKRRVVNPLSPANADVRTFLVDVVRPGHRFGDSVSYVCRAPCFSNLAKAGKHHAAFQELMAALGTPEAKGVPGGTTQTETETQTQADICTQSHSHDSPQHLTETSFSSSLDLEQEPDPSDRELLHVSSSNSQVNVYACMYMVQSSLPCVTSYYTSRIVDGPVIFIIKCGSGVTPSPHCMPGQKTSAAGLSMPNRSVTRTNTPTSTLKVIHLDVYVHVGFYDHVVYTLTGYTHERKDYCKTVQHRHSFQADSEVHAIQETRIHCKNTPKGSCVA